MEQEIPFGNSNRENGTTFLDFPLFLGIFQWDEPTKRVPFTAEPEIPEILTKWKAPLIYMYTLENKLIKLKICAKVARFIKTKQIQTLKKRTLSLSRCKPTIDLTTFELGCLGPAVSNGSIFSFCVWFYLTLAITVKILLFTCI